MDRDEKGRYIKGASGNPGGQPKGLATRAREATKDGQALVEFFIRVFRGEEPGTKLEHKLDAASWLADRGWGRPTQPINGQLGLTIEQVAQFLGQQGPPKSEQ